MASKILINANRAGFKSDKARIVASSTSLENITPLKAGKFKLNGADISIAKSDNLSSITRKLNRKSGATGVTAEVVKRSGSYQLVLKSKKDRVVLDDIGGVFTELHKRNLIGSNKNALIKVTRLGKSSTNVNFIYNRYINNSPLVQLMELNGAIKSYLAGRDHEETPNKVIDFTTENQKMPQPQQVIEAIKKGEEKVKEEQLPELQKNAKEKLSAFDDFIPDIDFEIDVEANKEKAEPDDILIQPQALENDIEALEPDIIEEEILNVEGDIIVVPNEELIEEEDVAIEAAIIDNPKQELEELAPTINEALIPNFEEEAIVEVQSEENQSTESAHIHLLAEGEMHVPLPKVAMEQSLENSVQDEVISSELLPISIDFGDISAVQDDILSSESLVEEDSEIFETTIAYSPEEINELADIERNAERLIETIEKSEDLSITPLRKEDIIKVLRPVSPGFSPIENKSEDESGIFESEYEGVQEDANAPKEKIKFTSKLDEMAEQFRNNLAKNRATSPNPIPNIGKTEETEKPLSKLEQMAERFRSKLNKTVPTDLKSVSVQDMGPLNTSVTKKKKEIKDDSLNISQEMKRILATIKSPEEKLKYSNVVKKFLNAGTSENIKEESNRRNTLNAIRKFVEAKTVDLETKDSELYKLFTAHSQKVRNNESHLYDKNAKDSIAVYVRAYLLVSKYKELIPEFMVRPKGIIPAPKLK